MGTHDQLSCEGNAPTPAPSAPRAPPRSKLGLRLAAAASLVLLALSLVDFSPSTWLKADDDDPADPNSISATEPDDSDVASQVRMARNLALRPDAVATESLYRLTFSPAAEVRQAALEAISQRPPTSQMRRRVEDLAESDESPLVRGHARLLVADWKLADPTPNSTPTPKSVSRTPVLDPTFRKGPSTPVESSAGNRIRTPKLPSVPKAARKPVTKAAEPKHSVPSALSKARKSPLTDHSVEPAAFEELDRDAGAARAQPTAFAGDDDNDPLFELDAPDTGDLNRPDSHQFEPGILDDSTDRGFDDSILPVYDMSTLFQYDTDVPLGFTGPSGVLPTEDQEDSHFVPVEDRWRTGFPEWDRYDRGHPFGEDYPFVEGHWWDPYNLNVLKGDYPIVGQHTFLNITGVAQTFQEYRQVPTATTPFESTRNPFQEQFFGNPEQYFTTNFFRVKLDTFHGNAAFKPVDWRIVVEGVFNVNYLDVQELAIVNPDVRHGTTRLKEFAALEQAFVEVKLADLSPDYDFVSLRAGPQPFVSDFRGFLFADTNNAIRLFGTRLAQRDQFNLVFFDQLEKDTNSGLNELLPLVRRRQQIVIANYYRQDFIFPGYTAQVSFHWDHDQPSTKFDKNDELVRPDPAGVFQEHKINAYYLGWAGDGHMDRINVTHQFYYVIGRDDFNPIAGGPMDIDAQMAALELSYDRDYVRFRGSFFYASGSSDASGKTGTGFDSIFDNPNFAGGRFSYWQRQAIKLFGVNLKQRESLVPDLRSSKIEGQANFMNPGLLLLNAGMDVQATPKSRVFTNCNYLWFDSTQVLEQFTYQSNISKDIGVDASIGIEYRPFLNDNVILTGGYAALVPGKGIDDLFGSTDPFTLANAKNIEAPLMNAAFLEMTLTY